MAADAQQAAPAHFSNYPAPKPRSAVDEWLQTAVQPDVEHLSEEDRAQTERSSSCDTLPEADPSQASHDVRALRFTAHQARESAREAHAYLRGRNAQQDTTGAPPMFGGPPLIDANGFTAEDHAATKVREACAGCKGECVRL